MLKALLKFALFCFTVCVVTSMPVICIVIGVPSIIMYVVIPIWCIAFAIGLNVIFDRLDCLEKKENVF